ncbi:hypothetical protein LEL_03706 [Akanthomyces lecanii RCEF 1005]|uniref:Uncharacterized protein n=1 Tax=Akanthomyces lecanii RCEF 1005 TaxID=1081108 RepID=A0A168JBD8_CORDF|nr:hypothetical protein LEL_03706 [Akanthomyces lecanii RCEF 1005]
MCGFMRARLALSSEKKKDTECDEPNNDTYANTNTHFHFWAKAVIARQTLVTKRKPRVVKPLRVWRLLELVIWGVFNLHSVSANGCSADTRVTGSSDVVLVMICTHGNVVGKEGSLELLL